MLRRPLPILLFLVLTSRLHAHQIVENALDIVIYPDKITIDARIAIEEVLAIESDSNTRPAHEAWPKLAAQHQAYLLAHLKIKADEKPLAGNSTTPPTITPGPTEDLALINYHLEYPLRKPPQTVSISHDLMREKSNWQCSALVRIRRGDIPIFQSALLTPSRSIEFDLDWPPNPTTAPTTTQSPPIESAGPTGHIRTETPLYPTIRAYTAHGIAHILTGFDHLLFVSALVLAAKSFWDLIKVVSAFTLAHTLTLTLSVFNVVTLSPRIVEPMIAASIVFVAIQNIFWPRQSRGWSRLALAFAFGLFHGLGFAGGLKAAMSQMPVTYLSLALLSFSLGVEIGHQFVVIPLFTFLKLIRSRNQVAPAIDGKLLKLGSAAISLAGVYFFFQAIRG
jgi:hydrogenase/urease accessory protein HupE